eukprot:scaffold109453_cov54-Phaeocystis_antarctica.AAC.1
MLRDPSAHLYSSCGKYCAPSWGCPWGCPALGPCQARACRQSSAAGRGQCGGASSHGVLAALPARQLQ